VYGGCKGNQNNFLSELECVRRCGDEIAIAELPPDIPHVHPPEIGKNYRWKLRKFIHRKSVRIATGSSPSSSTGNLKELSWAVRSFIHQKLVRTFAEISHSSF